MKNKEPVNLYQTLHQSSALFDRARNPVFFYPRYILSTTQQGFMYQGQKLVNLLPANILSSGNVQIFKGRVKSWIKLNITALPPSNLGS